MQEVGPVAAVDVVVAAIAPDSVVASHRPNRIVTRGAADHFAGIALSVGIENATPIEIVPDIAVEGGADKSGGADLTQHAVGIHGRSCGALQGREGRRMHGRSGHFDEAVGH